MSRSKFSISCPSLVRRLFILSEDVTRIEIDIENRDESQDIAQSFRVAERVAAERNANRQFGDGNDADSEPLRQQFLDAVNRTLAPAQVVDEPIRIEPETTDSQNHVRACVERAVTIGAFKKLIPVVLVRPSPGRLQESTAFVGIRKCVGHVDPHDDFCPVGQINWLDERERAVVIGRAYGFFCHDLFPFRVMSVTIIVPDTVAQRPCP